MYCVRLFLFGPELGSPAYQCTCESDERAWENGVPWVISEPIAATLIKLRSRPGIGFRKPNLRFGDDYF
jgi:hypothetical protein